MNRQRKRFKGRQSSSQFVALPTHMLKSEQWKSLTPFEVKLLIDLAAQYNGRNNGDLCATWKIMSRHGWNSPATLHKAIRGLIKKGFIELTRQGGKHCPSLYGLSFRGIDECMGKLDVAANPVPSNLWKTGFPAHDVNQSSRQMNQSAPNGADSCAR